MTTFFLTDPSGFAASFDEVDDEMMRVEIRRVGAFGDVETDVEFMERSAARTMWSLAMKRGATREPGWPLWADFDAPAPEKCEDPESHDGEECDCAWKRAQGWVYLNNYTHGGGGWSRTGYPEN